MFGSTNAFGQSSSSPFGSQSVFGQTTNVNSNPFAPKPFGSTTPCGSQTGGSIFGGTSAGMVGALQSSSPFSSTTAFGASSSPASGSFAPAFGATSTSAFGSSSTSVGGSYIFGQKPAFGGFSSTTQTSPFGSTNQQSQPAFGSGLFGSTTPFGASSQSAFAASSSPRFGGTSRTPAFGASGTLGFGASSTPSFDASRTPTFGATASPAFGTGIASGVCSNSVFGSGGGFEALSTPVFGTSSTSSFGASTSGNGASSTFGFGGAFNTPAFGSTPGFGTSSALSFSFSSSPSFGESSSTFGNTPFGASSPFSTQSFPFGGQATTATFGSTGFGQLGFVGNCGGSRVMAYSATVENFGQSEKLESISAMPAYKNKSHEELRWEDYQLGDKGGLITPGQSFSRVNFGVSNALTNPFASSCTFGQSFASPFSSSISSNPFSVKPFGASSMPAFSPSPFTTSPSFSPFQLTSTFGSTSFSASSSPSFGQSTSAFGNTSFGTTTSPFSTQSFPFATTTTFGSTGFGQSGFAGNRGGSRVVAYSAIAETDNIFGQPGKLESISAMPAYIDKSHEELRWEDYQLRDKGDQATTTTFGSTGFGQSRFVGNRGGSRVMAYSATAENFGQSEKLESISAMPAYKDKSHEELRWEDYQLGDKGGLITPGQSSSRVNFGVFSTPTNPFALSSSFGQSSVSPFSSSISSNPFSTKPFGASNTPAFSPSPSSNPFQLTSTFGSTSSSASSSPSFGQSTSAFGNTPFGTTTSPFSTQSFPFATTTTFGSTGFGQSGFAGNCGGSRVVAYSTTVENFGQSEKLESISAMPAYKDNCHEELRWEDYQFGDKGGLLTLGQSFGRVSFGVSSAPTNPFASSTKFGQSSVSPFSSSISSNPFSAKPFGASSTSAFSPSPFIASPFSNPFQLTSAFGSTSSSAFTTNTAPSLFGLASALVFGSTPSLFTSTIGQTISSPFANFTNTRPSLSFQSTAPSSWQTCSAFGQVASSFVPSITPSFTQSSMFSTPSSGSAFSSTQSLMSQFAYLHLEVNVLLKEGGIVMTQDIRSGPKDQAKATMGEKNEQQPTMADESQAHAMADENQLNAKLIPADTKKKDQFEEQLAK